MWALKKETKFKKSQLRKDIALSLTAELSTVAAKFGAGSKKMEKAITKSARALAEKMAKIAKLPIEQVNESPTAAPVVKEPIKNKLK